MAKIRNKKIPATIRVVDTNVDEMNEKIRSHRLSILKNVLIVLVIGVALVAGIYFINKQRGFASHTVSGSYENPGGGQAVYALFKGKLVKCSNDGVSYIDSSNNAVWSRAYEMQDPLMDISGDYLVVADRLGHTIYIQNSSTTLGSIDTGMAIEQVNISSDGSVFAVVSDADAKYMKYFTKEGELIAEGRVQMKKSGYPLDCDLAGDGKKLAVSYLYVSDGIVKTNIVFYNFGAAGQEKIDNIVSSYSYDNLIVTDIEFLKNDKAVAFGDNHVYVFEGAQKPVLKHDFEVASPIEKLFYDEEHFGFICESNDTESVRKVYIYTASGTSVHQFGISTIYDNVKMTGDNVIMFSKNELALYKFDGQIRYKGHYDLSLVDVIPVSQTSYILVSPEKIEYVKMN